MKIRILPLSATLRPGSQHFDFPPGYHDYSVEQDFELWLRDSEYYTEGHSDWDYLPAYWNRWEFNCVANGRNINVIDFRLAQRAIDEAVKSDLHTFTIAEPDPHYYRPQLNFHNMVVFTGSRKAVYPDSQRVFDIPILTHPHATPVPGPKRWLLFFKGNHTTHPLRQQMIDELNHRPDCVVEEGHCSLPDYVRLIQDSYIALAPRGSGMQSYRFYEAMQIGTVPLYLTDVDARPFRQFLDWDSCSLLRDRAAGLYDEFSGWDKQELLQMGDAAQNLYFEHLQYRRWCRYVVATLEALS